MQRGGAGRPLSAPQKDAGELEQQLHFSVSMMEHVHNLFGSPGSLSSPHKHASHRGNPSTGPPQPSSNGSRHALPAQLFQELAAQYGDLLDRAVEQRAYKGDRAVSADLREFSARLGRLQAGARDVIELHNRVLDNKLVTVSRTIAPSYLDEGRLLVLELMGYLLSYYRMQFLQVGRPAGSNGRDRSAPPGANRGADHG
jgi:hypothetical protein